MRIITLQLLVFITISSFGQTWEVYNTSNSEILSDNVTGISISENNTIWISTLSGVASFDNQWQTHPLNNSSYYDEIINIWCINNLIWIGTEFRGLWSYDGFNSWTHFHPNSAGNGIIGLGIDSNDTLWVLDKFGDFEKWNGSNWVEISDFFSQGNGLFIDKTDNIWLLSNNSGLEKYNNGEFIIDYDNTWDSIAEDYIPDASIHAMVEDSDGNYWIGGNYKGLMKFNGAEFTVFDTTNCGIASNKIRALAIDENNVLWIGTWDAGLSKFDGTTWTTYDQNNSPLTSNIINDIAIGTDGKIWIAHGYNEYMSPSGGKGIVVLDENNTNNNIANNYSNPEITIYPNPTLENIIIEIQDLYTIFDVELSDLDGRVLMFEKSSTNRTILKTNQLPQGIYFVRVRFNDYIEVKKIIKK